MTPSRWLLVFILLTLTGSFACALAQTGSTVLYLADSSTINGKIIARNDSVVIVTTSYGILKIPRHEVLWSGSSTPGNDRFGNREKEYSEGYPTCKGTKIVSGALNLAFASSNNVSSTALALSPGLVHFVSDGVGLGVEMNLTWADESGTSATAVSIGPRLMFVFGSKSKHAIPYIGIGYDYLSESISSHDYYSLYASTISQTVSGSIVKFSVGMLSMIGNNLAIPTELTVSSTSIQSQQITTISIGVGIAGVLY